MIRSIATVYFRNMARQRGTAAIAIFGLAIGIAAFLVMELFVRQETGFEKWLQGSEDIYAVEQSWTFPGAPVETSFSTMGALADILRAEIPDGAVTRVMDTDANVLAGGNPTSQPMRLVDSNFLTLFRFPLLEGDARTALSAPDSVVVGRRLATRYLGPGAAAGKTLTLVINGEKRNYRVSAVLADMPRNTEIESELLGRFEPAMIDPQRFDNWGAGSLKTFVRTGTPEDARRIEAVLDRLVATRATGDLGPTAGDNLKIRLLPLQDVHLKQAGLLRNVLAIGLVGLLALLVGCFNYVALMIAQANLRAREVAIRKVCGATRRQLVVQFLAESLITAVIATVFGLGLAEFALSGVNALSGTDIEIVYLGRDSVVPMVIGVILAIGLVAGAYPAFVLSSFRPSAVLTSARMAGGGRSAAIFRTGLVGVQFAIVVVVTIATAVTFLQARHMRTLDVGFQRDNLLVVASTRDGQLQPAQALAFVERARSIPAVTAATLADAAPGDEEFSKSGSVGRPGQAGERPTVRVTSVADDFARTYRINVVAGRFFDARFGQDDSASIANVETANVVLDHAAISAVGFSSAAAAVGQVIELDSDTGRNPVRIVGVIDNLLFQSPSAPPNATAYLYRRSAVPYGIAALRVQPGMSSAVTQEVRRRWREIAPDVPLDLSTAQQRLSSYYVNESRLSSLFLIGAIIAALNSCIGLYALTAFSAARRTKEIGIRKALGASTRDVVVLLGKQSLRPVVVAIAFALPVGYLVMTQWLAQFERRVEFGPLLLIEVAAGLFLVAFLTVITQINRASRRAPASALSYE